MDIFIPVFLASLVYVLKPGPHFTAAISHAMSGQWRSMLLYWVSATIAASVNYFVLLTGLSLVPETFGFVYIFIKSAAAMFFISLGVLEMEKASNMNEIEISKTKEKITRDKFFKNIISGVMVAFSNPYSIIFVLTIIPAITGQVSFTLLEIFYARSAVIAADFLVIFSIALPLLFVHARLSPKIMKIMRYASAMAMIGIGVYMLASMLLRWDLHISGLLTG